MWLVTLGAAKGEATYDAREWWQLAGQHDTDLWGAGAFRHAVLRRLCPATTMERRAILSFTFGGAAYHLHAELLRSG